MFPGSIARNEILGIAIGVFAAAAIIGGFILLKVWPSLTQAPLILSPDDVREAQQAADTRRSTRAGSPPVAPQAPAKPTAPAGDTIHVAAEGASSLLQLVAPEGASANPGEASPQAEFAPTVVPTATVDPAPVLSALAGESKAPAPTPLAPIKPPASGLTQATPAQATPSASAAPPVTKPTPPPAAASLTTKQSKLVPTKPVTPTQLVPAEQPAPVPPMPAQTVAAPAPAPVPPVGAAELSPAPAAPAEATPADAVTLAQTTPPQTPSNDGASASPSAVAPTAAMAQPVSPSAVASNPAMAATPSANAAAVTSPSEVHVVITYQGAVVGAVATAAKLASALRARGITRVDTNPVSYPVAANQVKFFHPPDAEQATSVGRFIAGAIDPQGRALAFQMTDLTTTQSAAEPGRIEIWLGGNESQPSAVDNSSLPSGVSGAPAPAN